MTTPTSYHVRTVPLDGDPLTAATGFARRAPRPSAVYERDGEWSCGAGALAEVVLTRTEIRYQTGAGWRTAPVGADPLRQVAEALGTIAVPGWRAYGWVAFELSYLLHSHLLHSHPLHGDGATAGDDPLLHLVVPEREARFAAGVATLRAVDGSQLADLVDAVATQALPPPALPGPEADSELGGSDYLRAVAAAVADIRAGGLRKVILSRVVPVDGEVDLLATYEAGRRGNTPARSFVVDLGGVRAAGFSPETVVEVSPDGLVSTQPLAGTRALSGDAPADRARRVVLLSDPKEIYEHAVSVQASQDELRRVCRPGSVVVDEFMSVLERGSVQHLASRVTGRLAAGRDAWDALASVFPSITASGIPKAAAFSAIARHEQQPRGLYSGAVVTVDSDGRLDAALALRTVFQRDGRTWLRAGAGIVEQSDPARELEETKEKLRSVSRFLVPASAPPPPAAVLPVPVPGQATAAAAGPAANLDDLRRTVADLLEEDPASIGDEANLFELGLESIALMQTVSRWRRAGIEVSFGELAENPTVDGWFKLLSTRAPEPTEPASGPAVAGETASTPDTEAPTGDAEFPLALMQHAYWIGRDDGQPLGQVAAHLYTEFDGADVDPARLRTAVERLVARHDMLRVRVTDNGQQVVAATSGWRGLTVHDLRDVDDAEVAARLDAVRDRLSHELLDIERGEVFATELSLLPGGRTRLHLDVDMVAADALSYRVLLADLAKLYGQPDQELPPLSYSYRGYRAARGPARREAARRDAEWWQRRLPSMPGAPELPRAAHVARAGSGVDAGRVARRHFTLPPEAREALGRCAHSRGVTPAMAVATAFAEVLGAWSAQPRFVLNVPLFDREQVHPDVNQIVGDFTSSVLLEVDLTERLDFAARVRRMQARLHADAAHSDYSGVEVLRDLTRLHGEQVLAPVVFTSALNLGELFDAGVRRNFGDPVWIISQGPQVLLDAQVTELDGGLLVNWDFREAEFPPGVVDAMFGAFETRIRGLADGVSWDDPVDELLSDDVRALRRAVGDTAGPRSTRLLHEGFFDHAARAPHAPALLWGDGSLTYQQLAGQALRVAGSLDRRGVRPGDLVGVSLPKGPGQLVAVLGVLSAGAAYVPVGIEQPAARVARIASAAGFGVMITDGDDPSVPDGVARLRLADALDAAPAEAPRLTAAAGEPGSGEPSSLDLPAYVLFTSGSTGQPKGVEVGHRAAMNTIDDLVERLGLGVGDRTLAVSALDFDLSVFDVFAPLSSGGAVVLVEQQARREAERWAELVREHRVTVLNCVPTVLDMLLSTGSELGDSLRVVLLGGERVGVDLPGRLAAAVPGCRFFGLGGTTETAIHSTVCEVVRGGPVPPEWRSVPYGTPLRNVRLRVVDSLGRDCPDFVAGELWIGGDGVARGYVGDPERTADRFVEFDGGRWYRTGDLARYLPDGVVEFLGRRDDQVKVRGFRIELGEVEAALGAVSGVRSAVAVLTGTEAGRVPVLGAGVVLKPASTGAADGTTDSAAVREGLRLVLPSHMVPELLVVLDQIPLTANGKTDRRAAAALLDAAAGTRASDRVAPRTDLEQVIMNVWRDVLGGGEFGVTDEFFGLGGDSVLATAVVSRLREELDTAAVSVRALFAAPTVAATADWMRRSEEVPGRLDRVAAVVMEIAALSDDEVAAQLDESSALDESSGLGEPSGPGAPSGTGASGAGASR